MLRLIGSIIGTFAGSFLAVLILAAPHAQAPESTWQLPLVAMADATVGNGSSNGVQSLSCGSSNLTCSASSGAITIDMGANPNASGAIKDTPTINSVAVSSWLLPLYTSAGGAAATATAHCVQGSAGVVTASTKVTITLSNNAVFTSGTSYTLSLSESDNTGTLAQALAPTARNQAATTFDIDNNDATNSHTIVYLACGI